MARSGPRRPPDMGGRGTYEDAFSASLSALCILRGREYRFVAANRIFRDAVLPGADLIGRSVLEIVPDVYEQGFGPLMDAVYETGEPQYGRGMELRLPGREPRYFDFVYAPMRDDRGEVHGIYVEAHDVTEQVLTRRALEESERRHRLLAEHATDMISRHTPEGVYLYASPACRALTGYEPEELVGRSAYDFFHREDLRMIQGSHAAILARPDTDTVSYRLRRKDGAWVWLETTSRTVRDPSTGSVREIIAVSRDVGERRRAEARVSFQAQLLEQVPVAVIATDPDGLVTHWNRHAEDLYGWSREEVLGRDVRGLTVGPSESAVAEEIMARLRAGRSWEGEFLATRRDGSSFPAYVIDSLVHDAQDRPVGIVGVSVDITERKRDAEERERLLAAERVARSEAEDALRVRDEFLSIASHELRNPVAVAKGSAQLLLRSLRRGRSDAERMERQLGAIVEATDRLAVLVDDLLDVSRLRSGQFPVRMRRTDLAGLARDEVRRAAALTREHRLLLVGADGPCAASVDPDRIRQVLVNLLDNAVKYSPGGGEVRVALSRDGSEAVLCVEDWGMGLPEGAEERIFEPFGRAANASGSNVPGMGLGLFICRRIAEAHGGTLVARSGGEGRGTTMCLRLPTEGRRDIATADREPSDG